jgi:hypothetical protein
MAESELQAVAHSLDLLSQTSHPEFLSDASHPNVPCQYCIDAHKADLACMEKIRSSCIEGIISAALAHRESTPEADSKGFSIREVHHEGDEELGASLARLITLKLLVLASRYLPDPSLPSLPCGSSPLQPKCADTASDIVSMMSKSSPDTSPGETKLQTLILSLSGEMIPMIKLALKNSMPTHEFNIKAEEDSTGLALPNGSTFHRYQLSRSLAWIIRALNSQAISKLLPILIPTIIVIMDDPSPLVKSSGCWVIHHLAVTATTADLLWQKDLLLDLALRSILGADELTWPHALQASVALVVSLEGNEARCNGYHLLMMDLLTEAERGLHIKAKRLPFLLYICPLIQAMGLTTLRYISRLMPLVIESLHSYDVESRIAAVLLLYNVVKCSWVRITSHLPLILRHLEAAFDRDCKAIKKLNGSFQIIDLAAEGEGNAAGSESTKVVHDILRIVRLLIKIQPNLLSHFERAEESSELRGIIKNLRI